MVRPWKIEGLHLSISIQANTLSRDAPSFAARYLALNETFKNPFCLPLTQRGHYSEVNCLIASVVYGLIHKRRLIVDDSNFEGMRWSDLYASKLPTAPKSVIDTVDPEWMLLMDNDHRFSSVRRRTHRHYMRKLPVWSRQLGMLMGVFNASRLLVSELCEPAHPAPSPSLPSNYAAFHIRRGDKILGSLVDGKRTEPESQDTPIGSFLAIMHKKAPNIRDVWVMTDDYSAVEELRHAAPDIRFHTACDPQQRGYEQTEFSSLPPQTKLAERRRLIAETEVAARSSLFIGGFSSNVDRFIALRHHDPKSCFSIDRERKWYPA